MPTPKLSLIVLKTCQVELVAAFYSKLGFQFIQEQHGTGPIHYSTSLGEGVLEIYPLPSGKTADSTTRLGFVVSNIAAISESFPESLTRHAATGLSLILKDPDGVGRTYRSSIKNHPSKKGGCAMQPP